MVEEQKTILLVDDEETLTWSMSKNLALNKNYKVLSANSGEEALEVLQKIGEVDLIVSDIKMQGKDGLQLLNEVKARYPKTGFIIMTAYGSSQKRQEALEKGAIRYLEKPFMMDRVKGVINEVLQEMEQLFQPLDEDLKEQVRNNQALQELLSAKSSQVPELVSLKLASSDGECLLQAGSKGEQKDFKILYAVKVLNRVQLLSKKIAAGPLQEITLSTEKYNIILHALPDSPFLLYLVFGQSLLMGKAMLLVRQLDEQINGCLEK